MSAPAWLAASTGQQPQAAQVNQFLGTHAAVMVYSGALLLQQNTAGSGSVNTNGTYLAQQFTFSNSHPVGRVVLTLALTGAPVPTVVSLRPDNAGAPASTLLAAAALPPGFVGASPAAVSIPLPVTLSPGTYWIVAAAAGDAGDFFAWSKSNQVSGASTSTNGTSWTAQTYGLLFQVWDNTVVQPLVHTFEDAGARWTAFAVITTTSALTKLSEYTAAQAANDYLSSVRAFTQANGLPTSIT